MIGRSLTLAPFGVMALMAIGPAQPVAAPSDAPIARGGIAQVVAPVDDWKIAEIDPLPPLQKIVDAPAAAAPVYGLYAWCGDYLSCRAQIKAVGWPCIRLSGPPFDDRNEQGVLACAEDAQLYFLTSGGGKTVGGRNRYDSDAAFIEAYMKFLTDVLDAYGPGGRHCQTNPAFARNPLRYLEIWNEPNFKYMIPDREPRLEVEAEREALYGKVLKAAYQLIKSKAPTVQIIAPSAGGGAASGGAKRFVEHLLQQHPGLGDCFDIFSTHPYVVPGPPEADPIRPYGSNSIAKVLQINLKTLADHKVAPKPVWYTEVGWTFPQAAADGAFPDGKHKNVSPELQAAYIARMYAWALRLGVPHVFIMYVKDADGFNGGFFHNQTLKWRPSAHAVKNMIALMPHPKLVGAIADCVEGECIYRFKADAKDAASGEVIMASNVAGPKIVTIPVGHGPVRLVDMLGDEQTVQPAGGKLTVEIGPFPIYLVLPKL